VPAGESAGISHWRDGGMDLVLGARSQEGPQDLDYWRAAEELGCGQLALLLPTLPLDASLRLLDEYAAAVEQYRR